MVGSAVLLMLLPFAATAAADVVPPGEDFIAGPISGPWRRLFLDAAVVEESVGLTRSFHAAQKHPGSPVLVREHPWEGRGYVEGPYVYGTVAWDEGRLRMWYHSQTDGAYYNHYAESGNGLDWTRPSLGIIEFDGSTDNNIFLADCRDPEEHPPHKTEGQCHNPSVIKCPWETDPAKRYTLFCYGQDYRWARVAFSPDGLHWDFTRETAERGLFTSSDVLNFFRDPYRQRYACTWKSSNRRGRAVGIAFAQDPLSWSKPIDGPVFGADDLDPDATQIYGMPTFAYQGLYIGLPWIYNARWHKYGGYSDERLYESELGTPCTMDVQLAWSWDLISWTRPPERANFIARGEKGEFDSDMLFTARAPVQVGDELYFYYSGWDGPHNATGGLHCAIGLATLRLDGFCSMDAGTEEGWLISRREPFHVPKVLINAKTEPDGFIAAELLSRDNEVIRGFSRDECRRFSGDAVSHVLQWEAEQLPEEYRAVDKKIRFILRKGQLYSYLPDQTPAPLEIIYSPADNGRLRAHDASIPEASRFSRSGADSGYRVAEEGGVVYLDLHSVGGKMTDASYWKDVRFTDADDWCMESWLRVVDGGDEPNYGLACFVRPDGGRTIGLYLSETQVGINSRKPPHDHRTLRTIDMDTTDAFHWYRMVHTGGENGVVTISVDGREVLSIAYAKLFRRVDVGQNLVFGPNAADREGRVHVARYGFRVGRTDPIFGPIE